MDAIRRSRKNRQKLAFRILKLLSDCEAGRDYYTVSGEHYFVCAEKRRQDAGATNEIEA
jgi:hypothetical protein